MRRSIRSTWLIPLLVPAVALSAAACGGAALAPSATPAERPTATSTPSSALALPSASSESVAPPTDEASPSASEPPDAGGGTAAGDVPDNAVFLTFHDTSPSFSIQYVEGWQVARQADGVVIRDKDSSETVKIEALPPDVPAFIASTDLLALQGQAGFRLIKQDTVKVGPKRLIHLRYHVPAPADPVTGKQVPSTVDRYYVPGPDRLALVSLSTPDGVDNVDAFRQMIESFQWS